MNLTNKLRGGVSLHFYSTYIEKRLEGSMMKISSGK